MDPRVPGQPAPVYVADLPLCAQLTWLLAGALVATLPPTGELVFSDLLLSGD